MIYGDHMSAGGWTASIFLALLVILPAGLVIASLRRRNTPASPRNSSRSSGPALDRPDRRLASGEIGEDEHPGVGSALTSRQPPSDRPDEPARGAIGASR